MSQNCDEKFTVSVVIPAYNAEQYIRRAVDSVLSQTRQADEIIVVDDGSTDATGDILNSYGNRIVNIQQNNAGVSAACNTGIQNAKSRWIAFLDSDDIWLPEKLEYQMSLLQRNKNLKWVMCNYYFIDNRNNKVTVHLNPSEAQQIMGQKDWFTFFEGAVAGMGWARSCTVAERNVLKEAGFFRSGYSAAEDLDICIRIAFIYPEIGFVVLPLAEYNFRRGNSISSQSYIDLVKARCQNLDDLIELSKRYENHKTFKPLAGKLLADWSSSLLGEEIDGSMLIRYILNHFNRFLPMNYKIKVRLKIMFPRISDFLFNKYFMLKKSLGLSKNR